MEIHKDQSIQENNRYAWRMATLKLLGGCLFFLGLIGIVLPLLPTTIFWILAAFCFAKAHPESLLRIYAVPKFGPVVEDFVLYRIIRPKGKIIAITGVLGVGGLSVWLGNLSGWPFYVLAVALLLVCLYIVMQRSY